MNLPFRSAFIVPHTFEYVVCSFPQNSKKSLIYFLIYSFHSIVNCSFLELVTFLLFLLLLMSISNIWWSDMRHYSKYFIINFRLLIWYISYHLIKSVYTCFLYDNVVTFVRNFMKCLNYSLFFVFRLNAL